MKITHIIKILYVNKLAQFTAYLANTNIFTYIITYNVNNYISLLVSHS